MHVLLRLRVDVLQRAEITCTDKENYIRLTCKDNIWQESVDPDSDDPNALMKPFDCLHGVS